MIIVKIAKGLGNQMFSYAIGKVLASRFNSPLKLDVEWFDRFSKNQGLTGSLTSRQFLLPFLNVTESIATAQEIESVTHDQANCHKVTCDFGLWSNPLTFISKYPVIENEEYQVEFDCFWKGYQTVKPPVYISGNFFSERYWLGFEEVIQNCFTFPIGSAHTASLAQLISSCDSSVAIHVRHGDYCTPESITGRRRFITLGESYYISAIEHIKRNVFRPHFFVFSDDIEWCKSFFGTIDGVFTYVDSHGESECYYDLFLMTLCNNHIIANSTFSWWAAWLARKNGIVCTPQRWFFEPKYKNYNPSPQRWLRIKSGCMTPDSWF